MPKLHKCVFLLSFLFLCWLAMQAVHELGHVAGAIATGGKVEWVVLHPLTISRTDFSKNPHPLVVAWAGPVLGSLVPLLLLAVVKPERALAGVMIRFFIGFCLLANGLYIGLGSFGRIGDAGDLLRHGASPWSLWLFGIVATVVGVWFWHRLGTGLGWNRISSGVTPRTAYAMAGLLFGIAVTLSLLCR